ncbi:UNVERIFIED_CONTAM: hypothetical protein PYX00_006498 [Menopon gallinae]|uniref:CUB domain-containing protein n=1 Tax=Menopon gallinae TaxID=328185 RepID=A0AAW2HWN3_9NEOP
MRNGQFYLILLQVTAVLCQYEYVRPSRVRNGQQFTLNTRDWGTRDDGERWYTLGMAKSSPNVCNVRFRFSTGYFDCEDDYLIIDGRKICGRLREYYEFPFGRGEWNLRYRGEFPLEIRVEQMECEERYLSCDIVIRNLTGEITSPNYPDGYPSFSNCRYTILPANEAICQASVHFHDFDVEDSPDCVKDRLTIDDEAFCGRIKNYRTVRNLTNSLVLRFTSDSSVSGRGFRINVDQIHCGNTLRLSVEECCRREFRDPYMILTSPGFLGAQWVESNCQFTIYQSQPNMCRLRLRFKHFWVGEEDLFYGCVNGYLQIDGRRFCGCLDGHEHVTRFENGKKELLYNQRGQGNRGFVIEVFQEECEREFPNWNNTDVDPDTEIEVFMTNMTSEKAVSQFLVPRDSSRCHYWNHPGWKRDVLEFLNTSPVPTFCDDRNIIRNFVTASQFYPDTPEVPEPPPPAPPEVPVFIPPVVPPEGPVFIPPVVPPGIFLPTLEIHGNVMGRFRSPSYRGTYPNNIEHLYIFQVLPNSCGVQITFGDFDLEKSFKCWKDYLEIQGMGRYCGNYLRGKTRKFIIRPNGALLLVFKTDGYITRYGFNGIYKQIFCFSPYAKLSKTNNVMRNSSKAIANE